MLITNFLLYLHCQKTNEMDFKKKKRSEYEKDLKFYLRYYKKVNDRMKLEFDYQIELLVEILKNY